MKAAKYRGYRQMGRLIQMPSLWLLLFLLASFSTIGGTGYVFDTSEKTLGGDLTISEIDDARNGAPFTVVLDAGHGGHDPGNLGNGYLEKNIALNIVLKTGEILEKHPDIKVIYTRKDDTFVDLYVRGEIANKAGADLFVSVHCDSHTSRAQGAGTFVLGLHANEQNFEIAKKENSVIYLEDDYKSRYADYDINSPQSVIGLTIMQEEFLDQSIALAKAIQDQFTELKRVDRKVKQAGFIVLHQTFMPSVLVETGFLTHKEEGAFLNSKKGQSDMGTAIADAILRYKKDASANMADFGGNATAQTPEPPGNDTAAGDTASSENHTSDLDGKADRKKSRKERKREREAAEMKKNAESASERVSKTQEDAANASSEVAANASNKTEETMPKSATGSEGASTSNEKETSTSASEEREKTASASREIENNKDMAQEGNAQSPNTNGKDTAQIIEDAKARSAASDKSIGKQTPGEVVVTTNPAITSRKESAAEKEKTSNIVYKVQIMASEKDIPLRPQSFNGLNRVAKEPYKNLYRYVYGSTTSLEEAKMMKRNADMKGYPTSFIAVYRDGERISFKEMKQYIQGQ